MNIPPLDLDAAAKHLLLEPGQIGRRSEADLDGYGARVLSRNLKKLIEGRTVSRVAPEAMPFGSSSADRRRCEGIRSLYQDLSMCELSVSFLWYPVHLRFWTTPEREEARWRKRV